MQTLRLGMAWYTRNTSARKNSRAHVSRVPSARKNGKGLGTRLGCDRLEHDACRFRTRRFPGTDKSSVCKLCLQEPEDQTHFIARCPRLEAVRSQLLLTPPPPLQSLRPTHSQHQFIPGQTFDDHVTQKFAIDFLHNLRLYRNSLLSKSHCFSPQRLTLPLWRL